MIILYMVIHPYGYFKLLTVDKSKFFKRFNLFLKNLFINKAVINLTTSGPCHLLSTWFRKDNGQKIFQNNLIPVWVNE